VEGVKEGVKEEEEEEEDGEVVGEIGMVERWAEEERRTGEDEE